MTDPLSPSARETLAQVAQQATPQQSTMGLLRARLVARAVELRNVPRPHGSLGLTVDSEDANLFDDAANAIETLCEGLVQTILGNQQEADELLLCRAALRAAEARALEAETMLGKPHRCDSCDQWIYLERTSHVARKGGDQ